MLLTLDFNLFKYSIIPTFLSIIYKKLNFEPKQGWYAEVNQETGELLEPNMRLKDLMSREDIWNKILTNTKFNDYIKTRYSLEVQATEDLEDEVDLE